MRATCPQTAQVYMITRLATWLHCYIYSERVLAIIDLVYIAPSFINYNKLHASLPPLNRIYTIIIGTTISTFEPLASCIGFFFKRQIQSIRESVDSLCRDDADMPMPPYIRKACNRPNAAFDLQPKSKA